MFHVFGHFVIWTYFGHILEGFGNIFTGVCFTGIFFSFANFLLIDEKTLRELPLFGDPKLNVVSNRKILCRDLHTDW